MAVDNSSVKSNSVADSYVGSLISLTSKSEIRYEGILYYINTVESSIGLQNVRSFGTEGREKDGPQVPPSDRVYEYILFRGTDIKDLQVKSSPPVQPQPTVNIDPAIIQSHYPSPMPTSSSLPSTVSGSLPDISSLNRQTGQHGMGFQNGMPLYQPGGNPASWGASPIPPMYWQGSYNPPSNGLPQLHQQSLIRPPHGLPMPSSLQQPLQYSNFNPPPPTGSSTWQGSSLPEATSSLLSFSNSSQIPAPSSLSFSDLPVMVSSGLQSTLQSAPFPSLASGMTHPFLSNRSPIDAPPTLSQDTNLLPFSQSTTRDTETSMGLPFNNKPTPVFLPQTKPVTSTPVTGISNSIIQDKPQPLPITPGQLLQSGSVAVSLSEPSKNADKDVEVAQVSSPAVLKQSSPIKSEALPPILPLPSSARRTQKPNGHSSPTHYGYRGHGRGRGRGRGRGAGRSHQVMKFTEDFDFIAMNEKFNKDEVWGHLGKSAIGDGDVDDDDSLIVDEAESPKIEVKPIYNKDDFFDSLSSSTIDRDSQNARVRFSEQRKLDTETFGEFSRFRGGRGGRRGYGYGRNGHSRGGGYGGRGSGGYRSGGGGYEYGGRDNGGYSGSGGRGRDNEYGGRDNGGFGGSGGRGRGRDNEYGGRVNGGYSGSGGRGRGNGGYSGSEYGGRDGYGSRDGYGGRDQERGVYNRKS